ncbi:MAG: B-box zinc finger protein [Deltaproteobacteria bacterium]|nr:B-box zinc finger protein [Myxococcales bacterium]MDP3212477.1 B-box zinc finger protein [Deltaproteobacteria bacterium]
MRAAPGDVAALPPACADHPRREALVRCGDCARALCDECYRFRVDGRPTCARCAYEWSTRSARRASLAVSFVGICAGALVFAERRYHVWSSSPVEVVLGALAAVGIATAIALSGRGAQVTVENRDPEEPVAEALPQRGASGYRVNARRLLLAAAPRLSGRSTALVLMACLAASAVLLPAAVRLPRWVEVELVLALWWVIVAGALTTLLYRGFRLRDDVVYFTPWGRPALVEHGPGVAARPRGSSWADRLPSGCDPGCDGCSGDGEGLLVMLALAVVLGLALGAAWVLVELALPLVFFLMYWLFMRAIGRVANDRHGCEGSLARALGWGLGWATLYVLPVALASWALHALRR